MTSKIETYGFASELADDDEDSIDEAIVDEEEDDLDDTDDADHNYDAGDNHQAQNRDREMESLHSISYDTGCDVRHRRGAKPHGGDGGGEHFVAASPGATSTTNPCQASSTSPSFSSASSSLASSSPSSSSYLSSSRFFAPLRVFWRLLRGVFFSLPSRWRNWFVRGISGSALIAGFGFVIHMGPVALMSLSTILAIGCFHEVTLLCYNVYRAADVPFIRSLSWYYLFAILHFLYADSLARHANDYVSGADPIAAASTGGGLSEFLETAERLHPTTSFVLYVVGIAVAFLPLMLKQGRRRVRSRVGDAGGAEKKGNKSSHAGRTSSSSGAQLAAVDSPPPSTSSSSSSPSNSVNTMLKKQFVIFAWSHMAIFFFLFPSHFAVINISVGGHLWFLIPVSIVIFNDIAAYAFGFCFGKTPLIALSPKKTWEGFIGGGLSTLLFGAIFSGWYLDAALPASMTLKQLESLTLKNGAAELRRRGVDVGAVGVIRAEEDGGKETSHAEVLTALRRREIILRLDHYVCRVNASRWMIMGGGRGGGGGVGGGADDGEGFRDGEEEGIDWGRAYDETADGNERRLDWNEIASTTVCDRTAIMKLTNYSLPEVAKSAWKTLSSRDVDIVTIYPFQFHAFVFSIFGSLIAPFGGFFASGFKRAFGIKDFGAIIPGHGGLTDRFDCQLFMSFFVFVYHSSFVEPHYEGGEVVAEFDLDGNPKGFTSAAFAGGGVAGGGAGGFGRRRSSGVGGDPVGTSPLEIIKRVLKLEAGDQLWLFKKLGESLNQSEV